MSIERRHGEGGDAEDWAGEKGERREEKDEEGVEEEEEGSSLQSGSNTMRELSIVVEPEASKGGCQEGGHHSDDLWKEYACKLP